MARFAFSITARREMEIRHSCAVLVADSRFEADDIALAIARKLFPIADGWTCHHTATSDVNNVVTLESVQYAPRE